MALVIDSHHHFWKYSREQYGWIGEGQNILKRDFLPADLKKEIEAAKVDGVVSVQARQTVEETRWLLELAEKNDFIRGVVQRKEERHHIGEPDFVPASRTMVHIGG